jgi:ketosteroid isomerase-like protein
MTGDPEREQIPLGAVSGYSPEMTTSSQPHQREEVQAVVNRYRKLRARIDEGLEPNGFGALADFYTDDAVYVDGAWGRIEGKEAIAHWLEHSVGGLGDWKFPVEFTAIEGDDVVVKWTQIIPGTRADGTSYSQSAYSRLRYAGNGKFSYEEDTYNMVHVLEDVEASGWVPQEPMNLPPEHPDRNWALPEL